MRKKYFNRMFAAMLMTALLAVGITGCGKEEQTENQEANTEETTVEEEIKEDDLEAILEYLPGIDKLDVVENAQNLDLEKALPTLIPEEKVTEVASITVDDKDLDIAKQGTYEVTVTVTLAETAGQDDASGNSGAETVASGSEQETVEDTDTADSETPESNPNTTETTPSGEDAADSAEDTAEDTENAASEGTADQTGGDDADDTVLEGTVEVDVIDKEDAEANAEKGDVVITDDNVIIGQEDTPAEETAEAATETTAPAEETEDAGNAASSGSTSSSGSSASNSRPSGGSSSSSGNSGSSSSSKPAGCSHNWQEAGYNETTYTTVTDYEERPIYKEMIVCGCGATFSSAEGTNGWEYHSAFSGCPYGYSVKNVQTGTETVAVGTHQEPSGTKWVSTGYKCTKCGATK